MMTQLFIQWVAFAIIINIIIPITNVRLQEHSLKGIHNVDSASTYIEIPLNDSIDILTKKIYSKTEVRIYKGLYGLHYTLYPSPVNEHTTLTMYFDMLINDIRIHDIIGREFICQYKVNGPSAEIFTRDLPIGRYILKISHNRGISVIPLVVMR